MPICAPENPALATESERRVWELLRAELQPEDVLIVNLRLTDRTKDYELDLVVVLPGAGIVVVEVKGSPITYDGAKWWQHWMSGPRHIDPVAQARTGKYALRDYVDADPRWQRRRVRWSHAIVLTDTELPADFATPDCPRWSVVDRTQLDDLGAVLRDVAGRQESVAPPPDEDDAELLVEILRGRGLPQRDVVTLAAEREIAAQRLTIEQSVILGATQLLHRVEVRGGAGSGKTWLAVEQARRLAAAGQRVAMVCYSRGLAAYLRRAFAAYPRKQRPAYIGEFLGLGHLWGAAPGSDDDSDYWERRLPTEMLSLATGLADGHRFDAVVVDEAQDFADLWWPALLAALRDPEESGVYVFSDEGQRIFPRYGSPPVLLVPLVLDHNMRNTKQIADVINPLAPMRMRLVGGDGAAVQLVECAAGEALGRADDMVDELLEEGWRPQDVALLTTGSRHPEQTRLQEIGQAHYWESFWDEDTVFYGHVLGCKGLERSAVVLAINERAERDRARERLYVGMSRARDRLVVCGYSAWIEAIGGVEVLKRLRAGRVSGAAGTPAVSVAGKFSWGLTLECTPRSSVRECA